MKELANHVENISYQYLSKYNKNRLVFDPYLVAKNKGIRIDFVSGRKYRNVVARIATSKNNQPHFFVYANTTQENRVVLLTYLLVYVEFYWTEKTSAVFYNTVFDTKKNSETVQGKILTRFVQSVLLPEPYVRLMWSIHEDVQVVSKIFDVPETMLTDTLSRYHIS